MALWTLEKQRAKVQIERNWRLALMSSERWCKLANPWCHASAFKDPVADKGAPVPVRNGVKGI